MPVIPQTPTCVKPIPCMGCESLIQALTGSPLLGVCYNCYTRCGCPSSIDDITIVHRRSVVCDYVPESSEASRVIAFLFGGVLNAR